MGDTMWVNHFGLGWRAKDKFIEKKRTKELQVMRYCPLTPPVTKQSAHAITLQDTDRRYN